MWRLEREEKVAERGEEWRKAQRSRGERDPVLAVYPVTGVN